MQDGMNVAIAVNEKYVRYAYVMLTSLFENHRSIAVNVCVLYNDMKEESIQQLCSLGKEYGQNLYTIYIDVNDFPKELPHAEQWPMEIYFRLALTDVLPEKVERILYLDVDVIIIDSIWDFYNMDLNGRTMCACAEKNAVDGFTEKQKELFRGIYEEPDFKYFNSGVLLIDLGKVRNSFDLRRFCDMALSLPLYCPDQDLLNYLFLGDVVFAEGERYNLFANQAYQRGIGYEWVKEHTAIIHYTGIKPWLYKALRFKLERFWWEYAKKTPFYLELLEEIVLNDIDTCFTYNLVGRMKEEKGELLEALRKCMDMLDRIQRGRE